MEQIEIIERSVVESRRPLTTTEALNYVPQSQIRRSTEQFVSNGNSPQMDDPDKRFHLTGERDVAKEDSFVLYNNNSGLSPPQEAKGFGGINNYGYDLNEVQTAEGGARIIQTHGSGHLLSPEADPSSLFTSPSVPMRDRSLESMGGGLGRSPPVYHRETTSKEVDYRVTEHSVAGLPDPADLSHGSDQLHSILKNADSWKRFSSSEDNSLARKDSYKRMQENQMDNGTFHPPVNSQVTTIASKSSPQRWVFSNNRSRRDDDSDTFWRRVRKAFERIMRRIMDREWDRRLVGSLALALSLFFVLLFIIWLIVSSLFFNSTSKSFLLYPPVCEECLKRNPAMSSYRPPSKVYVQISSPAQAHFELVGNPPFKSNSFTAVDFNTGYVAISDHALTDENGRHTACFIMQLDRNALPSMSALRDALDNTYEEVRNQFGWQEYWQFNVESVDESYVHDKFRDKIDDCKNAKWYFLRHAVYTKDSSCSECYDFCLPDFAVQRRQKYEDEVSLTIRRLNCFRFYVPEWSRYQIAADESGGHWQYPKHSQKNTQRDAYKNWVDWSDPRQQSTTK